MEWQQTRARFYADRFPAEPFCERCNRRFVPLEGHHLNYDRFQRELASDVLFICISPCHPILDRERAARERKFAAEKRAERRRREIRQFKDRFKKLARRRGGHDPTRVRWFYRRFIRRWRECRYPSYGAYIELREAQRWFERVHKFMTREYGPFWFALYDFEFGEGLYVAFLDERRKQKDWT